MATIKTTIKRRNGTGWDELRPKTELDQIVDIDDVTIDNLGDITDVNVSSVSSGEFLKYDGTNWVPGTVASTFNGGTITNNLRIESGSFASLILDRGTTGSGSVLQFENNNGLIGGIGAFGDDGLQFRTANGTQMVLSSADRLGIGTQSPASKLDVDGNVRFYRSGQSALQTYSAKAGLELSGYQSTSGSPYTKTSDIVANADGTVASTMRFFTKASGSSSPTERIRIESDGDVQFNGSQVRGKSVNGDKSMLDYWGGVRFTWDSDSYGANDHHSIRSTYGNTWGDDLTINSFHHLRVNIDANSNNTDARFEIGHNTTGTENLLFVVREDGKVGIGTDTSPLTTLEVKGDDGLYITTETNNPTDGAQIRFSDNSTQSQYGFIRYKHANNTVETEPVNSDDGFIIGGSETNTVVNIQGHLSVQQQSNFEDEVEIDSGDLIVRDGAGIFNGNDSSRVLYLRGNGNIVQFQGASNQNVWEVVGREANFYIYNNDLSKYSLFIDDGTNNIGINGQGSPAHALDVIGNIKASNDMYAARYYDLNNTSYYIDSGSTSEVNNVNVRGDLVIDANNNNEKLYISRYGGTSGEFTSISRGDLITEFHTKNDEETSTVRFKFENTDTESGGGADASNRNIDLISDANNARIVIDGNTVWHAGNDGPSSGLNADLLDNLQASAFLQKSGGNMTGDLQMNHEGNTLADRGSHSIVFQGYAASPLNTTYTKELSMNTDGKLTFASNAVATESYVDTAVSDLVDSSPEALNTLNELAAALGDDANFSTTVTDSIATKLPLAGGTLTGTLTARAINMQNYTLSNVGQMSFNDPGPNEGISWNGGNFKIYESPNDLSTNSAGNLQFVSGGSRRLTVQTDGTVYAPGAIQSGDSVVTPKIQATGNQDKTKFRVWSGGTYGIGMHSNYTFGGLGVSGGEYAMTFQMNDDDDRGFWWGDSVHTEAQGAMALTTAGLLTVADKIRVGYGQSDTTTPSTYSLDAEGNIQANELHLNDANTILKEGGNNSVRIQTNSGYVDVGPQNTGFSHFSTNIGRFYFNKGADFDGDIRAYSNNTTKIEESTGYIYELGNRVLTTASNIANADTADTLTTARNIQLTGDVTGSVSFNGSANVSITTTVADDSHNHTIANIDNLQTSLNGKLSTTAAAAAITYVTSCPTSNNTTGMKVYVGSTDCSTKYSGWLYLIT